MSHEQAEITLIAAAEAGDRAALQQLLLNHCDAISRQIGNQLPVRIQTIVSVEDVLQQTLTQAVRDFGKRTSHGAASFRSWLGAIAEHRVRDAVKNHGRLKRDGGCRQVVVAGDRTASSMVDLVELLSDHRPSPSKQVAAGEAVRAVQVGVAALPDDQRHAVVLRYFHGLSVDETAAEMRRTPGAVRGLVDRAKQSLRRALGNSSRWFSGK